ncbi:MAG: hypothetical protein A4S09_05855 [Proteobacteria bacterium SG_bin7]|nr:MAG: hypothetical protein A4S09_05855 [Proteobacteria bacterium SG_bin7]
MLRVKILLISTLSLVSITNAHGGISNEKYYYYEAPYVPQERDYGLELGSMMMESGMYWLGANLGFHSGSCFGNPNCQQYYDLGFGAGGRDGETEYIGSISGRFQWVRYPSSWSPFARIFLGVLNTIYPPAAKHEFTYGIGGGITHRLHENLDLRMELRVGQAHQSYAQGMIGLQLKIDKVIAAFAGKIKDLGEGTVEGTKKVIQGIGDVVIPKKENKEQITEDKK